MPSVGDTGVPSEEPRDGSRERGGIISTRSSLIVTASAIVGLVVGLSAGVSASISVGPSVDGEWRVVIGLLAGLAGSVVAILATAATLNGLIHR